MCALVEHWMRRYPKNLRSGKMKDHDGHCRKNKNRKTEFYHADELKLIAQTHFTSLTSDPDAMPVPDSLRYLYRNKYDFLIAGWTKFWSEVLKPDDPHSPDLIKAFIATESSFETPKNHHIELSVDESREPSTNIAAGIRWFHHKKKLRERRLRKKVTWEEAIIEYKGLAPHRGKVKKSDDIMVKVRKYYGRLHKIRRNK